MRLSSPVQIRLRPKQVKTVEGHAFLSVVVKNASAARNAPQQKVRTSNLSTTATLTSEYGVYPASTRSASSPEHIQRPYHPSHDHSGSGTEMAQTPSSPSSPTPSPQSQQHERPEQTYPSPPPVISPLARSDDVPIDPSIAAPSPTYGAHQQYSPYGAPSAQDMQHGYAQGGGLYPQTRPDWAGYAGQPNPMAAGHHVYHQQPPNSAQAQGRPTQVRDSRGKRQQRVACASNAPVVVRWQLTQEKLCAALTFSGVMRRCTPRYMRRLVYNQQAQASTGRGGA